MPLWLVAVLLGTLEGLTEFIPVSSTGHLLIAEHWLGSRQSDLFNVVIQCGAVLAVVPLFRDRIAMMLRWREPASRDLNLKILAAFCITGAGGLAIDKLGFRLPGTVQPVALALIVGGIAFIAVEAWLKHRPLADCISWPVALLVAAGQLMAAAFPGSSRSGVTILFAMALGANRATATEFSFLVGIPTMMAAGGYKVFKELRGGSDEDWALLALATLVAAAVSFVAVRWLLRHVQTHTLVGFGVYRIVLGIVLLLILAG